MSKLVGVLGGMGPMATADFFRKLVEETPAERDEDHVPIIIYSVPQMPSRNKAITSAGESPLPQMLAGMRALKIQHVDFVAIPCNTAHFWYDDLCREGGLPILHIVDAVCNELGNRHGMQGPIGLLCTEATLSSRIYHDRLSERGIELMVNPREERDEFVNPGIELVKRGRLKEAGIAVQAAAARLLERGARRLILGWTELPVALEAGAASSMELCIDATRALARACVSRALA
ncbi:MAG: cysteate racemase [Burkholderiales bacterium]